MKTCPYYHLPSGRHEFVGAFSMHGGVTAAAKAAGISPSTGKEHLRALRCRLGVTTNIDLIRILTVRGILNGDTDTPLTGRTCLGPRPT